MHRWSGRREGHAAVVVAVLLAVAACGGHSGPPKPPKPGQARMLGQTTASGDIGPLDGTSGMAAGSGGTVYFNTDEHLVRLGTDGKFEDVSGRQTGRPVPSDRSLSGLVVRSDGSLLAGEDGQVLAIAPDGRITELAGTAGQFRSMTATVPKSAAAVGFRFTRGVAPLGVEKDGTVIIADGGAVWSLSSERLTRRYWAAPVKSGAEYQAPFLGAQSTTDPDGTVFLAPRADAATLGDVVVLSGDGQPPHKLTLLARVPDLSVATTDLAISALAGDGADGIYANVFRTKGAGSYVLHVHGDQVDVVASTTATAASATCKAQKPVPARDFPCPFPGGIAYRAGHVYLGGQRSYVLDIGVAAS